MDEDHVKFLIAEDEPAVQSLIRSVLAERDYREVEVAGDGQEALEKLPVWRPDILITDLKMPRLDGEELARRALALEPDLTVIVTTGNGTIQNAVRMLKEGAFDFITKPFSIDALIASIEGGVERTKSIAELNGVREVIEALMAALESKDIYLKGHSGRVSRMAGFVARALGWPRKQVRLLECAALVHDVGKIGIHEQILNKRGHLTAEEMEEMKKHTLFSREILRPVGYLRDVLPDVYHHHERFDGLGYPEGLAGEAIPVGARIISICDSYDAMASNRAYRAAMPPAEVRKVLLEQRGSQFDGKLVDLFLSCLPKMKEAYVLEDPAVRG